MASYICFCIDNPSKKKKNIHQCTPQKNAIYVHVCLIIIITVNQSLALRTSNIIPIISISGVIHLMSNPRMPIYRRMLELMPAAALVSSRHIHQLKEKKSKLTSAPEAHISPSPP